MQYFLIQEPNADVKRIMFIKSYRQEIWDNFNLDAEIYAKRSAISKVPLVQLSKKERHEIQTQNPVFLMGGMLSQAMSADPDLQRANVRSITDAGDPVKALAAFESQMAKLSPEELKGAMVVISFDPHMFTGDMSLEQMKQATIDLLDKLQERGAKIVMTTPLNTSRTSPDKRSFAKKPESYYNYIGGKRSMEEAYETRKQYVNFLAEMYQGRKMDAMVDVAEGVASTKYVGSNEYEYVYFNDPHDFNKGLNADGLRASVNGIIDGINLANGNNPVEGQTTEVITSASPEIYYYGTGETYRSAVAGEKPVEGSKQVEGKAGGEKAAEQREAPPTIELMHGYESIPSVAKMPEKARMALWRIQYAHMCADVGLFKLDEKEVKDLVDQNEHFINEIEDPRQRDFARMDFMREKAGIYYMYAWKAWVKGDFDHAVELVKDAREKNKDYLATYDSAIFKKKLDSLENVATRRIRAGVDPGQADIGKNEHPDRQEADKDGRKG
jgi:hypothetical protein